MAVVRRRRQGWVGVVAGSVAAVAVLRHPLVSLKEGVVANLAAALRIEEEEVDPSWKRRMRIEAWNEHSRANGLAGAGYPFVSRGSVVEPYAATDFVVKNVPSSAVLIRATWSITDEAGVETLRQETSRPTLEQHTLTELGTYTIRAELRLASSTNFETEATEIAEATMTCRYVRREIRSLSSMARIRFLDAFTTAAKTSTEEGQVKYGSKYRGLDDFVKIHLIAAGGRDTDHLHDGVGFLMQHVALTSEFETSLRAIDAAVSLPYWDFTYDKAERSDLQGLWKEELWSDEYFGDALNSPNHTVETGRFAYQRVTRDSTAPITNPYGYLRSPWNMNKSPFVTRCHSLGEVSPPFDRWPGCDAHHTLVFEYNTVYDFMWQAQAAPHGDVHTAIGGYLKTGPAFEDLYGIVPESAVGEMLMQLVTLIKSLYRDLPHLHNSTTHFNFPKSCSFDTPQSDCHMICPDRGSWAGLYDSDFSVALRNAWRSHAAWIDNFDDPTKFALFLRWLCLTPFSPGEQMESGSPVDVSFWPIHPTLDRLLHYKRLIDPFPHASWFDQGTTTALEASSDVSDDPTKSAVADRNGVGRSSLASSSSSGRTKHRTIWCDAYSNDASTGCEGHHPWDLTKFATHVYDTNSSTWTMKFLSNSELFNYSDPHNYRLDYIYEHFVWKHCDEEGYRFPSLAFS